MKSGNTVMFGLMLAALSAQPVSDTALPQDLQQQLLLQTSADDEQPITQDNNTPNK